MIVLRYGRVWVCCAGALALLGGCVQRKGQLQSTAVSAGANLGVTADARRPLRRIDQLFARAQEKMIQMPFYRVKTASVAWADYELILTDFPQLRNELMLSAGFSKSDTDKRDSWLLGEVAYIAEPQPQQITANSPVHLVRQAMSRSDVPEYSALDEFQDEVVRANFEVSSKLMAQHLEHLDHQRAHTPFQPWTGPRFLEILPQSSEGMRQRSERLENWTDPGPAVETRVGYNPTGYHRSAVFEVRAFEPTQESPGLLGVKGSGYLNWSRDEKHKFGPNAQMRRYTFSASSGSTNLYFDAVAMGEGVVKRNGLVSLGEAIREVIYQRLMQKIFNAAFEHDLDETGKQNISKETFKNFAYQTNKVYAIVDWGFDKKWPSERWKESDHCPVSEAPDADDCVRAALIVRQAHKREVQESLSARDRETKGANLLQVLKRHGVMTNIDGFGLWRSNESVYGNLQWSDLYDFYDFGTVGVVPPCPHPITQAGGVTSSSQGLDPECQRVGLSNHFCSTDVCLDFKAWGFDFGWNGIELEKYNRGRTAKVHIRKGYTDVFAQDAGRFYPLQTLDTNAFDPWSIALLKPTARHDHQWIRGHQVARAYVAQQRNRQIISDHINGMLQATPEKVREASAGYFGAASC